VNTKKIYNLQGEWDFMGRAKKDRGRQRWNERSVRQGVEEGGDRKKKRSRTPWGGQRKKHVSQEKMVASEGDNSGVSGQKTPRQHELGYTDPQEKSKKKRNVFYVPTTKNL